MSRLPSDEQRRRELAEFLRSRRERRSPADVGLPAGGRRRTPGLRREEVATLAGVSVTWYTWLEQAREMRASRQVLGALVGVLGLDEVESAHLFRLAGEVPPGESAVVSSELPWRYGLLLSQLDPHPAFVTNRRFDVLAWNRAAELMCPEFATVEPERRNMLWLTFTSAAMQAMTDDWKATAAETVALFRARSGDGVLDPQVAELIRELGEESEEFRALWERRDLAGFTPSSRALIHPLLGRVEVEYLKMNTSGDDLTLVAYLAPKGSELARRFGELLD